MSDGNGGKGSAAVDLDSMTLRQLTALIAAAEAKRREKREGALAALRAEVERRAAELGISPGDLFARTRQQPLAERANRGGKPRAVRYRGPNGEEWSGRGRPPKWLAALEAEGRDRKEFAVEPESKLC